MQLQRDRTNLEYNRKALKERTDNLVQRHRELTALNAVFQKHLETQEQEETNHRELQVTVQDLLHQIQSLTDELEHRRRVEQKVE